jgi:prepilin-type N-terminal cleavage/methylation domain-containing protein
VGINDEQADMKKFLNYFETKRSWRGWDRRAGMSLVELLVSIGIAGIVMTFAVRYYRTYLEQKWVQETKSNMQATKEQVAAVLRKKIPRSIAALSVSPPTTNAAVWTCPSGGPCRLSTDAVNGIRIEVTCTSTSGISILDKTPFDQVSANLTGQCIKCGKGTRPVMTIQLYTGGVLTSSKQFPQTNAYNNLVAMGMCFDAPLYQENTGTAAVPNMVNRWDRWKITLLPYYFTQMPTVSHSAAELAARIKFVPEQIMLAPDAQLGPNMRIIR